jgi:dTDP-4-amino-4,6-dideoxygalactose transaminase
MNFDSVRIFEQEVAAFFGAPYAVAVDSCTHGIELCLRRAKAIGIYCPRNTYLSVPMLANKLNIELTWRDEDWKNCYWLANNIFDAAVLWKQNSYIAASFMCLSFQYQKHLSLGRGGMILTDNKEAAHELKVMSYDGRIPGIPWREQNIKSFGYHYYMTPETAELGLKKLPEAIKIPPRQWTINDWPDISKMDVFKTT